MSKLLAYTCAKNQARFLPEWVAHHLSLGIKTLIVYTDHSEDQTETMAKALAEDGFIRHFPNTTDIPLTFSKASSTLWKETWTKDFKWILPLDIREFLTLSTLDGMASELLHRVPDGVDGIVLPRRIFGGNNVETLNEGDMLDQIRYATYDYLPYPYEASLGKILMRRKQSTFVRPGFYRPRQKSLNNKHKHIYITPSLDKVPEDFAMNEQKISIAGFYKKLSRAWISMFPIRGLEDYLVNGYTEGENLRYHRATLEHYIENNFNTELDMHVNRHQKMRHEILAKMMKNKTLKSTFDDSVQRLHSAYEAAQDTPETQNLSTLIKMIGSSQELPIIEGRKLSNEMQIKMETESEDAKNRLSRFRAAREKILTRSKDIDNNDKDE